MNILPFIIVLLLFFKTTLNAQNSAQVKLSIRLYPISHIEIEPVGDQDDELSNERAESQLATFSTSQFVMNVQNICSICFKKMFSSSAAPSGEREDKPINRHSDPVALVDDSYLVYLMETL